MYIYLYTYTIIYAHILCTHGQLPRKINLEVQVHNLQTQYCYGFALNKTVKCRWGLCVRVSTYIQCKTLKTKTDRMKYRLVENGSLVCSNVNAF